MLLFKPEHVDMILEGRKTQTRRTGKRRWKVGSTHQCRLKMLDKDSCFATVGIKAVREEPFMDVSDEDAVREGYANAEQFIAKFREIYGDEPTRGDVWVVDFALVSQEVTFTQEDAANLLRDGGEFQSISLPSLANGALTVLFEDELAKVLENILDARTDAEAIRSIKLEIKIKPNEGRNSANRVQPQTGHLEVTWR